MEVVDSGQKRKVTDLVNDLVLRLSSSSSLNPNHTHFNKSLRYAFRILSSRISPSVAPDSYAIADSIKRHLAAQGKSSKALTFSELYATFAAKTGPGSVNNKWAVLYLLKVISQDRQNSLLKSDTSCGGLPALFEEYHFPKTHDSKALLAGGRENGVLFVMKDPENIRDLAFREFVNLFKEECEVSEEALVRDVLYSCQGIDGSYVKFDSKTDGYMLNDLIKIPRATKTMVCKLCEIGGLFRRVKSYISESMDRFPAEDIGTVGQAFCAAMQDELSEYYKLLAVLESQSMNPIPLVSESVTSGNYLSLRRLSVWFVEPMVKMRLMASLVDKCGSSRGGAMVGAIHLHAQHGDPLVHEFMRRLLRRVCSPLFEMVRTWVLEGELDDMFAEFFILAQPVKAESLWREGYQLHAGMLPSFISQSLAQRILRAGKSINFLRVCCDDRGWADAAAEAASAAGTITGRGGLGYGETDALESLVSEASKRIDKHLLEVIYKRYRFKEHCLAIKRYLLLGQGDFVQYLMDIVGPELSEPANTISTFKLAGLLESAIRSSNAQYDDHDILDRLRVKMMPHGTGDRGWDVFSLEYDARVPLDTVFTESVMARYLKIFNFLWKLRRVEHALIGAWKTMKPNCTTSHFSTKLQGSVKLQLLLALRRCQVLWDEMNHFVSNLQYYIMFEVLEVSWSDFSNEMEVAKDLDDLLVAHEKYLNSIVEKSLLGERSQALYKTLFTLFDLILRFRSHADRLYEGITELQARITVASSSSRDKTKVARSAKEKSSDPGSWLSDGRKALTQRAGEFLNGTGQDLNTIANEYSSLLEGFISQLPIQHHVDLKFLMFRLDFTEFYTRQQPIV
uniref:Gamma-tubulin complex component n=1 Tax=Kalanchoe fedtschenkoi TaxID=63787 RepID=A0A7N1A3W6_KALFE